MTPNRTILIAEDSDTDLESLIKALKSVGVKNAIQSVRDGAQTLEYLSRRGIYKDETKYPTPGILFLDLHMPKQNGLKVLEYLRTANLRTEILIVVLTGVTRDQSLDQAYALGAHSFLRKPVRLEDLKNLVSFYAEKWILARGAV
jgi:two-component system response regulator